MNSLPLGATEASLLRYHLAEELERSCPPELGREIALAGSAARGIADEYSDIELNLWVDELPTREEWWKWLQKLGASDVSPDALTDEALGTMWVTFRFRGVWIEAGWQRIARIEEVLGQILAGEATDHPRLIQASVVDEALPLRSNGFLAGLKEQISHYPDVVQAKLIKENTSIWSDPHVPGVRWALVQRGDRFALAMRLLWDIQNLVYVLFAVNRVWQPDWKWMEQATRTLPLKPERLADRINQVFTLEEPERSVETAFQLILDTLELVPDQYEVSAAAISIRRALDRRPE